uniref:DUF7448 domain-containing protein n=1 Tax=viral metagenome TaxID=1070528 RepID=A0A6C0H664_9ZZZZ
MTTNYDIKDLNNEEFILANKEIVNIIELNDLSHWGGYVITLKNDKKIVLKISNERRCCEEFGYFINKKSDNNLIGAKIRTIKVYVNNNVDDNFIKGKVINFIFKTTDYKNFDIMLYNYHNGWYSHDISVQIIDECFLYEI